MLRYILVISSLLLLLFLKFEAVPIIIIIYFLVSLIQFRSGDKNLSVK
jgi:CDP-diacylglycerol--serine O-phosphatidyltransferase